MDDVLEPLPLPEWKPTCDTLHMWMQVVGKVPTRPRAAREPLVGDGAVRESARADHVGHPLSRPRFDCEFDFIDHQLVIRSVMAAARAYRSRRGP